MTSHDKERQKELRRANLESRRERLRKLLSDEAEQHREQMRRGTAAAVASSADELRAKRAVLAEARRDEQRKEADEKMLQHWKLNNPDFRQVKQQGYSSVNRVLDECGQTRSDLIAIMVYCPLCATMH